jgi:hypothetical protein
VCARGAWFERVHLLISPAVADKSIMFPPRPSRIPTIYTPIISFRVPASSSAPPSGQPRATRPTVGARILSLEIPLSRRLGQLQSEQPCPGALLDRAHTLTVPVHHCLKSLKHSLSERARGRPAGGDRDQRLTMLCVPICALSGAPPQRSKPPPPRRLPCSSTSR